MTSESPIVDEVRARAMEISARYGHDLKRYAEHRSEIERQHRHRVVSQITVIAPPESKAAQPGIDAGS